MFSGVERDNVRALPLKYIWHSEVAILNHFHGLMSETNLPGENTI